MRPRPGHCKGSTPRLRECSRTQRSRRALRTLPAFARWRPEPCSGRGDIASPSGGTPALSPQKKCLTECPTPGDISWRLCLILRTTGIAPPPLAPRIHSMAGSPLGGGGSLPPPYALSPRGGSARPPPCGLPLSGGGLPPRRGDSPRGGASPSLLAAPARAAVRRRPRFRSRRRSTAGSAPIRPYARRSVHARRRRSKRRRPRTGRRAPAGGGASDARRRAGRARWRTAPPSSSRRRALGIRPRRNALAAGCGRASARASSGRTCRTGGRI